MWNTVTPAATAAAVAAGSCFEAVAISNQSVASSTAVATSARVAGLVAKRLMPLVAKQLVRSVNTRLESGAGVACGGGGGNNKSNNE